MQHGADYLMITNEGNVWKGTETIINLHITYSMKTQYIFSFFF